MQAFLKLYNYYRQYIEEYAKKVAILINITKKQAICIGTRRTKNVR